MPVCQIVPDIYQITLPTPFAVGDVHAYLLRGDPLTLIDTGVLYPPSEQGLRSALAGIGILPADLEQIILSHSHIDHVGQARWLAEESGATVFAHVNACDKLADLDAYAQRGLDWAMPVLDQTGLPANRHGPIRAFYEFIPSMAESVTAEHCLGEGDSLMAGGVEWRVMFCPGHSGDLICFLDSDRGLLLSSDHLIAHISSNALLEPPQPGQPRRRPLLEYWQSLDRLAELDLDTLLPGHGEIIEDHRALLAARRAQRDRRLARIEAMTATAPQNAWQIASALFPKIVDADVFLALSEVIGHLDMLRAQGRVEIERGDGAAQYRAR